MDEHKISSTVFNPASDNLRKLTALFPSIMKDGQVDFEALKAELGTFEEAGKEQYGLTWAGKQEAKKNAAEPVFGRTLRYVPEESKNSETTENLYIEGDNLEVLKLLQSSYMGKVKMIYIDPPYNTGNDFVYKDKFSISEVENAKAEGDVSEEGGRYTINSKTSGKYHAKWLSMMYPRLRLAKNLLSDEGVIFVSIDDNEVDNLREIMDEIYGEENFVASVMWQRAFAPKNDAKFFSEDHDYVIIYAKSLFSFELKKLERTIDANNRYKNLDNDPRGIWISDNLTAKTYSEKYDYPITTPSGRIVNPSHGSCWRISEVKFKELVSDNRIWFGKDGNNVPRLKRFLSDVQDGMVPSTIWLYNQVGHNQEGRQEIKKLFDDKGYFDGPKPVRLLKKIIYVANLKDNDIVLDFFSGSATTAHAVMQLNAEDDGNRKFIMVQLPEVCPPDSEAARAGYRTISDIGKERIRRAGDKIVAESGKELDIGFKVFKTADTNIRWIAQENGMQISQTHLDDTTKSNLDRRDFMPDATDIDVAYEILLRQWDIPLSATMETLTDIGQRTYCFADTVVVCLEEEVTREIVDKIASIEPMPHKVIFRDSAFGKNISLKLNTMERFDAMMKRHGEKTKQAYTVEFL